MKSFRPPSGDIPHSRKPNPGPVRTSRANSVPQGTANKEMIGWP